MHNILC